MQDRLRPGRQLADPPPVGPNDTIGERIRRARLARNMSQRTLAQAIGRAEQQSLISMYEHDEIDISATTLARIAHELGTTVAALVGEAPDSLFADIDTSGLTERDRRELRAILRLLVSHRRDRAAHPD